MKYVFKYSNWPAWAVAVSIIIFITVLTIFLRTGGIVTDHMHGVSDWHPDSGRYFAQERMYIAGNYRPYAKSSLYSGNPYANILFLSWMWRAVNKVAIYTGRGPISTESIFLSIMGRAFYMFLSIITVITLFLISRHFFHSNLIAFLASFFFAVSPLAIGLNHTIKPELPMTCFMTLSACFVLLISERRKLLYYVFVGVFAGIATAMKYNGSIVMLYLVIIHTYKAFNDFEDHSLLKKIIYALFSPYLFTSFLLWAFFFYASEPILWDNFSKGIFYVRQYLRDTALWLLPRELCGDRLGIFLYNLKHTPQNLLVFLRASNVYFLFLGVTGIFFSKKYFLRKTLTIGLFPFIILSVLLLSKAFLGEEYLLHPLPFLYILSALGFYSIIERIKPRVLKNSVAILAVTSIVIYGLYIGFYEVKYFSLGSIPYHAQTWANANLKAQCVRTYRGTIGSPNPCKKGLSPSIFSSRRSDLASSHGNILLKTFCLENKKPLLNHLRGHKIMFYARRGNDFTGTPIIPACPVPHLSLKGIHFTRFLNGINFDPGYNTFLLRFRRTYNWRLISSRPLEFIKCKFINSDTSTVLVINRENHKPLHFLPFEKKDIKIPLLPSFPWRSPFIYDFNILMHTGHIVLKLDSTQKNDKNIRGNLYPGMPLEKFFMGTYHYNFKYLEPLLEKKIPLKQVKNLKTLDPLIAIKDFKDFCALNAHPIFLEKGFYLCNISTHLSIGKQGRVYFYILSLPDTLAQEILTQQNLAHYKTNSPFNYKITLPFKMDRDAMATFLVTHQGEAFINISKVILKTDFCKIERERSERQLAARFLSTHQFSLNVKLDGICLEAINGDKSFKMGSIYFKNNDYKRAKRWFKSAISKNPINKVYLSALQNVCRRTGRNEKVKEIEKRINFLGNYYYGPWIFETGLTLNALWIPQNACKREKIPVRIFLARHAISGDQSAFFSFEKNGNFYFGKDFSLFDAKPTGELRHIDGTIQIPQNIPSGTYDVYFTFRIPKTDYRYHVVKENKILPATKILVGKIKINDK